jgi:hypothetical protein
MAETHTIGIAGHMTVVETPDADGFGAELVNSIASIRGYKEDVPNPDFDPEAEVTDPPTPETIPNPMSKETFAAMDILAYCRAMVVSERKKNGDIAPNALASQNETDKAKVTVVSSGYPVVNIPDTGTFTLKLYALGGDTLLNGAGDAITRGTNNKSHGDATVTEALTGVHEYRVTDASDNTIITGITEPLVDDTGTYRGFDYAGNIPNLVWDEVINTSSHNGAQAAGKLQRQAAQTLVTESSVNDASATTTSFVTNLTSAVSSFYSDSTLTFLTGALAGQSRVILSYDGGTKTITVDEAFSSAPADTDEFQIAADHVHPISQIQSGLATTANQLLMMGATFDTSTDSLEALQALITAVVGGGLSPSDLEAIIAGVQSVGDNVQQAQVGVLTGYQHSTWTAQLTDLPLLTGYDEIVFTLKRNKYDTDDNAVLKVSDVDGLQVLNGVAQTTPNTDATITVDQETPTGEITLVVQSDIMASVTSSSNYIDGFKKLDVGSDVVLRSGKTIIRDSGVDEVSP